MKRSFRRGRHRESFHKAATGIKTVATTGACGAAGIRAVLVDPEDGTITQRVIERRSIQGTVRAFDEAGPWV